MKGQNDVFVYDKFGAVGPDTVRASEKKRAFKEVILDYIDGYCIAGLVTGFFITSWYYTLWHIYGKNHTQDKIFKTLNDLSQEINNKDFDWEDDNPVIQIPFLTNFNPAPYKNHDIGDTNIDGCPFDLAATKKIHEVFDKICSTSSKSLDAQHKLQIYSNEIYTATNLIQMNEVHSKHAQLCNRAEEFVADSIKYNKIQEGLGGWYAYPEESGEQYAIRLANKQNINAKLVQDQKSLLYIEATLEIIRKKIKNVNA